MTRFDVHRATRPGLLCSVALTLTLLASGTAQAATVTLYDAALGTLPESQSWTYVAIGSVARAVSNGVLNFSTDTIAGNTTYAGWGRTDQTLDTSKGYDLAIRLQLTSENHANNNRAGFSLLAVGSDPKQSLELAFWQDEVWAYAFQNGAFVHGSGYAINTTEAARTYTLSVRNGNFSLLVDGAATTLSGALVDYTPATPFIDPYEVPNTIFFGDDTSSARANLAIQNVKVTYVPVPAAVWLLVSALLPLARLVRRGR